MLILNSNRLTEGTLLNAILDIHRGAILSLPLSRSLLRDKLLFCTRVFNYSHQLTVSTAAAW